MSEDTKTVKRFDAWALAVCVSAALTLVVEFFWPHDLREPLIASHAAITEDALAGIIEVGDLAQYGHATERPLFTPDRLPYVAPSPGGPPPQPAGPRIEFQLTAVIMTETTRMALLRSNLTPTVQRVGLNQSVDGWQLTELRPDSVTLRRDSELLLVELRPHLNGSQSGQAVRTTPLASEL